jgi:iron complex outermembrane receptor protein
MKLIPRLFVSLLAAEAALAAAALAQTPAPSNTETIVLSPFEVTASDQGGYAATNSVSGTRMRVNLQTHPQSIQVVTSELLSDIGAITATDALRYVSSVQPFGAVEGRFGLRGAFVSSVKRNGFDSNPEALSDMLFTERVEVVKGPTSLLYGLGNPGGVINIITKRPGAKSAYLARAQIDDEGAYRVEVDANTPLAGGKVLTRFLYGYEDTQTNVYLEERTKNILGGSFVWQALPGTKVSADINYLAHRGRDKTQSVPVNNARTDVIAVPRDWSISGPNPHRATDELNAWATIDHKFNDQLFLRNYTQYYDQDTQFTRRNIDNALAGDLTINATSVARDFQRGNLINQTDLLGNFEAAAGKVQVVVGYVYNKRTEDDKQWNQGGAAYAANPFPIFEYRSLPPDSPRFALGSNAFVGNPTTNWQSVDIVDHGVYALAQFTTLQDRLNIFGGARRDEVEQTTTLYATNATSTVKSTFDLPQIGAAFSPRPDLTFFVSYSESGQANSQYPDDPQEGNGVDYGVKFNLLEGRLSGSLVAFDMELSNIQLGIPGSSSTVLSGKETYQGFEADAVLTPLPNWSIVTSYAYTDAIDAADTVATAVGRPVASSPRHAFSFWNKYRFTQGPLAGGFIGGGMNYQTSMSAFSPSNANYRVRTDGYTKYDLLVGWAGKIRGTKLTLQLNIANLTDRTYIDRGLLYGRPRTYTFSSAISF